MIKKFTVLLAVGVLSMATACDDEQASPRPTASGTANAPATSTAATPPPSPTPTSVPTRRPSPDPTVTGSRVIMIDPEGKKYTRKEMVEMAAGMAAVQDKRLPANFCSMSYQQGVAEGGKFPAGKAAFMEACAEGVRLAG
ncbi:hypothetical protein GCM10023085_55530 [Actinomadura viridis]|uniref:Lipoprotein n=1 Tax=Actinomadura viridis TaxID=58110 RepID=A0A931GKK9_9ACTN|nr:hypothetical protein [Actinomadura viridis]MBG6086511.1 hypothetical protein [Actinomadura viridis]